jgi:predicted CoA-binding protein
MTEEISTLRRILTDYRTVAVVGLSMSWHRPSYFAAKYLQEHGFRVIPVNPRYANDTILGEQCYADLRSIPEPVDIVDCFRRSRDIPPIVEDAIAIGAKVVWMQLGVINEAAARTARAAGLEVVMDRCMKIEFARLFGGLNFMGVNTRIVSARRPQRVGF